MEALGINLGYLLLQIFMFGIVFMTLRAWVYKPIIALLDRRSKAIAQGLEDARIAGEARANAEREAEKILVEAQAKAASVIREATDRAEAANRDLKASAEAEISKLREQSRQEIEGERTRMLSELRSQVVTLAMAAAQKVIATSLDEQRQRDLLKEFFSGVNHGRVTLLEGVSLNASEAEVTSALPLTEDEKSTVINNILRCNQATPEVIFRVDPSLLGGLVVRVGDKVMDGSVAGQLQNLRMSLS